MTWTASIGLTLSLLLTGCGTLPWTADPEPLAPPRSGIPASQTVQRAQAHDFVVCSPPHCPQPTPKTSPAMEPPMASSAQPQGGTPPNGTAYTHALSIDFAAGRSELDARQTSRLAHAVAQARNLSYVRIAGETGGSGEARVDEALALARARAVRSYLRSRHPRLSPVIEVASQAVCCTDSAGDVAATSPPVPRVEVLLESGAEGL